MNKRHLIHLIFLMVSISTLVAQSDDISKLNVMHSLKVNSKYFKEPVKYNVTLPEGYSNNKDKSYYVLFDLHPRSHHFLSGLHDWLSHNGEWPWQKTIIITPADYNSEFAKLFGELRSNPKNQTILDYFENDLLKTIDKNYRTNGFKIFTGFMSNGAFGLYTLINRPRLFNAYIISSPTLANNFGGIISDAQEKLQNDDERLRFLYLSTGNHRYEQSSLASFSQIENTLKKISPKNIDWQVHRNTTNNYMSQPIVTTINGIEALFTDIHTNLKADSDISKQGMQAIIDHYKNISQKKYGFAISAEGSLKALASSLMKKDTKKALSIYHETVELYPNSAYAFSSLAKAYADMNEYQKAIKYQSIAVEKSKSMIIWHQNNLKNILENYKSQVSK